MKKSEDFIIRRLKNKAHKYALPTEYSHYFEDLPKKKSINMIYSYRNFLLEHLYYYLKQLITSGQFWVLKK